MKLYLVQYSYHHDYNCIFYTLDRRKAQAALRTQLQKELKLSKRFWKTKIEDFSEEDIERLKEKYSRYLGYGTNRTYEQFIDHELQTNKEMFYADLLKWHINEVELDKNYSFNWKNYE